LDTTKKNSPRTKEKKDNVAGTKNLAGPPKDRAVGSETKPWRKAPYAGRKKKGRVNAKKKSKQGRGEGKTGETFVLR